MKFIFLFNYTLVVHWGRKKAYDDVYEVQLHLPFNPNWFSSALIYTSLMCWILIKSFDFIIMFVSL